MKSKKIFRGLVLSIIIGVSIVSGMIVFDFDDIVDAAIVTYQEKPEIELIGYVPEKEAVKPVQSFDSELLTFVISETGLNHEESKYMIEIAKEKNIDLFILMGLIEKESKFTASATGRSGEIGLGQLMERTAKHYSQKIGYTFSREATYDPKINIDLVTEHLEYLDSIYDGNIHMMLTAYNRGSGGLQSYIETEKSPYEEPWMSTYSVGVVENSEAFKEKYEENNL